MTRASAKAATIHEIAKRAGVSIASVSRALNGKPGISEGLREHILAISREIDYRPSAAARQLISGKAAVVGISLGRKDIELRPYYILLYQHLTLALHRQGMVPVFFAHDQTARLPDSAGAAILLGEFPGDAREAWLGERQVPCVRVGESPSGFSVGLDERHGLYLATRHLVERGRRHIVFVGGELASPHKHLRLMGYRDALHEAGLEERLLSLPHEVVDASLTSYRYLNRWLVSLGKASTEPGHDLAFDNLPFDALACATDELALGCLAALEDHGIGVPQQVAVTGFDDLPTLADQLTTVRQDIEAVAERAVVLLGEALAGKPAQHVTLPVELMVRQTS
ncbi:LacI family DNA-binding transcriptional regulator [Halomonas urumqiensis]|uniref:LacI family transcriptional regulator n=1 Tax=Halomonas urumqiensis TaxID=1684789 RepID=A0A2N7UDE0_9GAMM|nr:LacI family DNA-binding transcriptional regulator [Halomonas urumqiensis]PMR78405.1 LacI family transcriptional regulator [Halomonas urumqiensis]PTB03551.1 LacI family transcriptional regulator [Halomonas urumqiensis]GHE20247.1 LacI family transcriptional regulator [Halomonas urumqiensis]